VGRNHYPDRLDELGVWFRLRFAYRTADRHDGAIEMLAAGIVLLLASTLTGEKLTTLPTCRAFWR
jgi:hypothetical protein